MTGHSNKFDLGNTNKRGEKMISANKFEMKIANTMYKVPKRKRYT